MQNGVWVHPFTSIIPVDKYNVFICHYIDNETQVYTYKSYLKLNSFQKQNPVMEHVLETFTTIHTHFGQFGLVKPLS